MARILTKEEIEKLEHTTRMNPCGLMIKLVVRMGLRHVEALDLRVQDYDAEEHRMRIRGANARSIPVPEEVRYPLLRSIHGRADSAYVVSNCLDGRRPLGARTFQAFLSRIGRRINVTELNVKNLRSTCIVQRLEAGIDPSLIQAEMGIRSVKSVTKYRAWGVDPSFQVRHEVRPAVQKLEAVVT